MNKKVICSNVKKCDNHQCYHRKKHIKNVFCRDDGCRKYANVFCVNEKGINKSISLCDKCRMKCWMRNNTNITEVISISWCLKRYASKK